MVPRIWLLFQLAARAFTVKRSIQISWLPGSTRPEVSIVTVILADLRLAAAPGVLVGCTDTWTSWVDPVNNPVIVGFASMLSLLIVASDVIITNGFPYWQGSAIEGANSTFYQSYT